jgi:hypothetical protein
MRDRPQPVGEIVGTGKHPEHTRRRERFFTGAMRAWAWGERTITACAELGTTRSSAKLPLPVRSRKSSLRGTGWPIPFAAVCDEVTRVSPAPTRQISPLAVPQLMQGSSHSGQARTQVQWCWLPSGQCAPQRSVACFDRCANKVVAARFVQNCTLRACLETRSRRGVGLEGQRTEVAAGYGGYGVETIFGVGDLKKAERHPGLLGRCRS